ncbi:MULTISPECIES: ABC transporter ATP-binding protein [Bacteroidales]|uniref:ABC transporter ATP-binding protein n=1 Tax=Xylanibacter rodentium TaxID=2736289 RepID=A0ABX2B0P3_9BACT|nr:MULTISPECIES: ABC transporter ATP-binding protein [Bacteroidales]NPE15227.1 ABC transporter ATP-binding protein [Xylanibacter rodentium]
MAIVSVENLKMSYGKGRVQALKGVSFDVGEGEIFGLIGPDGAGKTSLFRVLTTLLLADSGTAVVDGMDVVKDYKKIRQHIGYMPGRFSLYQDLTVEENLSFFATVFNTTIEENYHLVEDIYRQIEPFKKRKAGKLSGGMKQKLALSCALIHAPHVLFLDEPTTGVDPVSRKEFWEMLQKLKKNFKLSIVVSTPYMDEAVQCDRIAFIQEGQLLTIDTPENIIRAYTRTLWAVRSDKMHRLLTDLRGITGVNTAFAFGENHHATVDSSVLTIESLREQLVVIGHHNIVIEAVKPTTEDCFMNLQK